LNRFYIYKCVVDDGGAPCIDDGLLSLCICKPMIRSTAREGDWIFAFGSNDEKSVNRLAYIAEITRKLTKGQYYELDEFQKRGDCIYERSRTKKFRVRQNARFHGTQLGLAHDLGESPDYERANSLVSNNFRYFGAKGTAQWKEHAPNLTRLIEYLGQGHRVNHAETIRAELMKLKATIWKKFSRKLNGTPLHASSRDHRDGDDETIKICGKRCFKMKPMNKC
jgi:hypothetical protein